MSGNSQQRRRSARHWRHVYNLGFVSFNRVRLIRLWCENQYGQKNFARTWAVQTLTEENWPTQFFVAFNRDKDAAWFASKWIS